MPDLPGAGTRNVFRENQETVGMMKKLMLGIAMLASGCATSSSEREVFRSGQFWKVTFAKESRYPATDKLSYRVYRMPRGRGGSPTRLEIGPPHLSKPTSDFLAVSASGPGDDIFPAILVFAEDGNDGIKAFRVTPQGDDVLVRQL
ncbi:hypothetical protein [Luteimonas sp. e5]